VIGTPLVGAWIAQGAFWVLLAIGFGYGLLRWKAVAVFVTLWLLGSLAIPRIAWWTAPIVTSYVAGLDIALVFIVFQGDVRIG